MMIFWSVLILLTLLWYAVVTLIIAYRGGQDIVQMINQLQEKEDHDKQI